MAIRGVSGGRAAPARSAPAPSVDWGGDDSGDIEELEMVPDTPAAPPAASPPRPRRSGMVKVAAVGIVLALVAVSLGAMLLSQPAPGPDKPKPPKPPTDVISDQDVLISELRPSDQLYLQPTSVELRVGPGVADLKDWKLTTFDNDSYVFQSRPVSGDPAYVVLDFSAGRKTGGELSLDPADELALYAPDGKLSDFVRWSGGGADRDPPRGGWPSGESGVYLGQGQTVSRLDAGRCNATAWNASPPSPGRPNILELTLTGARQVLWLRSGRDFAPSLGTGASPLRLPAGRPVGRALLMETAAHLDFALRQIRRLGDPWSGQNSSTGAPVLEFWVTNGSSYRGITEPDGRVSLDLGPLRHVDSYVCAREIASLVLLSRWGAPEDQSLFLREGLATSEGLRAATLEISPGQPSVESLWSEMRNAGLPNPYEHGRNLTEPFIRPWDYDPHHLVNAWLFYDYTDRRFVESGLGPSLAQALLFAKKEPLTALQEQVGRNLSALFFGWLDWRNAPGFRYAAASLQVTAQLSLSGLDGMATLRAWTGWSARLMVNFSGSAEFNLSVDASSAGPLNFRLTSSRTGAAMINGLVPPGQSRSLLADGLRPQDELVLLAGAAELPGGLTFRAAGLPEGPGNITPPDGSYTMDPRPGLSWSTVEGAGSYQVQVAWDTAFLAPEIDATVPAPPFLPETGLPDGVHYWRVRGWTPLGNPTGWSAAAQLTVDTLAPFAFPEVDEPKYRASPDDAWNITGSTQISFRLNESGGSPEKVFYRFPGESSWTRYSGTFQAPGEDRSIDLEYYSQDDAGNLQSVQTLALALDSTPPAMEVAAGAPSYYRTAGDVVNISLATLLTITAADGGSGVSEVTYKVNSLPAAPYLAPFNLSGRDGPVLLSVSSTDRLGNQNTSLFRFNLDLTAPDLSVQGLVCGTLPRGALRVSATGTDQSGIARVSFMLDGQTLSVASAEPYDWDWDTSATPDGSHTVEVQMEDNLGNAASAVFSVKTDNTAPVTVLSFGAPRYRLSGADLWNVSAKTKFNLTATDPTAGVATSWYTIDGAYLEGSSFVLSKTLADGRHDITYGSRDRSGNNETAQTISVVLDNTSPVPQINTPAPASQLGGKVSIVAAETTGAKDVAGCTFSYSIDGATWTEIWTDTNSTSDWNCTWDTIGVTNGSYWLRAVMYDNVDNSVPSQIQVNVMN